MTNSLRRFRFALTGNGPISNRGCEAIVMGTCNILNNEFGVCDYLLASFAKDQSDKLPQNLVPLELNFDCSRYSKAWWIRQSRKVIGRKDPRNEVVRTIRPQLHGYDAMFSIGGDNYAIDYGFEIIDRLIAINTCAKEMNIPVIIWGASIGPFDCDKVFEQRISNHLSQIDLIVVREPESQHYLHSLGIKHNVVLAPDPAFAVKPIKPSFLASEIEEIIIRDFIGLNLSPVLSKYVTAGDLDRWLANATQIVTGLLEQFKEPILLIPHVASPQGDPRMDDWDFLESVRNQLPIQLRERVAIVSNTLGCEQLKWLISRAQIFIGSRTHSTIAALSTGVPCISVAYSRKAWGINDLIFGHQKWVEPAKDISTQKIVARVMQLQLEKKHVRDQLNQSALKMKQQSYDVAAYVRNIINR
jgi:colanic acid/amylovoran biosynthesis protein